MTNENENIISSNDDNSQLTTENNIENESVRKNADVTSVAGEDITDNPPIEAESETAPTEDESITDSDEPEHSEAESTTDESCETEPQEDEPSEPESCETESESNEPYDAEQAEATGDSAENAAEEADSDEAKSKEAVGDTEQKKEDVSEDDEKSELGDNIKHKRAKKVYPVGSRRIDSMFDFVELFIFTLVGVLIVTSFFFRHSVVSGGSMMNTLQDGDKLIVSDFMYEPKYMDIVVIEDYSAGVMKPIVKRVIATEGQLVRVSYDGISVNGQPLDEDGYVFTDMLHYEYDTRSYPTAFYQNETLVFERGEYYEFVVPEGEIFVLGDHRNDSNDSRKYGTLREDSIIGKVLVRFYPFEEFVFFIN